MALRKFHKGWEMLEKYVQKANKKYLQNIQDETDSLVNDRQEQAIRFLSMQSIINKKLAQSQMSVDNAENYPSTWTTNPDGGANGQV